MRERLAPRDRRDQLLEVAAKLLSEHGVDRVQITEVAQAAGVSRPVVYRFFGNRQALIVGVLEDFERALNQRFYAEGMRAIPGNLEDIANVFVVAVCDTIEAKGAGAWHLLDAKGPDPEIAKVGRTIQQRMIVPWYPRIAQVTGASDREVQAVAHMLVASGRAVLDLWLDGALTRQETVRAATRGIIGLLTEFSASAD